MIQCLVQEQFLLEDENDFYNASKIGHIMPVFRIRINWFLIRIQHFRLNTGPDPDPIRIQGIDD
jgi:hypothetical protein